MTEPKTAAPLDVLDAVQARYAAGAQTQIPELCCPVDYDASLLAVLPQEIEQGYMDVQQVQLHEQARMEVDQGPAVWIEGRAAGSAA